MPFIYEGLWPYTQNKVTKRYRWHFEDPDGPGANHIAVEEFVVDYGSEKLIVIKVESPKRTYHVIIGSHDEEENKYLKLSTRPVKEQKKILEFVTATLKLKGFVDL